MFHPLSGCTSPCFAQSTGTGGIRHILLEVDLLKVQTAAQKVSTTQGSSAISSTEMKRRCLLTALVIEATHLVSWHVPGT